jgi:CMP-N,N'-diacetyllegionaminic acid synthase
MSTLILIPARAGSRGLPGKNTKMLRDKPLISYTFDFSKAIKGVDDVICLSSNDTAAIEIAESENIQVPFKRPDELATDKVGSYDVIMHALTYFESLGRSFQQVLLLQPTSPLRTINDYHMLVEKFDKECDMAVTVKLSKENPYFTLFEEDREGYLRKSKEGEFMRRQDCPAVYSYNGSMYLIRVSSLKIGNMGSFQKIRKLLMPDERSVDIDTFADWILTEYFLNTFIDENS